MKRAKDMTYRVARRNWRRINTNFALGVYNPTTQKEVRVLIRKQVEAMYFSLEQPWLAKRVLAKFDTLRVYDTPEDTTFLQRDLRIKLEATASKDHDRCR
jgi:hypothetical protein